jgi:hypothetical protein
MCVDILDAWECFPVPDAMCVHVRTSWTRGNAHLFQMRSVCRRGRLRRVGMHTSQPICVHDSDSLQVKRQYARGRPGRVGILSCARCEVRVGADVSDA